MTGFALAGASLLTGLLAAGSSPAACAREDLLAIHGKWVMRPYERMRNGVPEADVHQVAQRVERIAAEPAILGPLGTAGFKEFASEPRGQALVFAPQLLVVYCSWENNSPSRAFRAEFERNVDLDALAALLDR